MKLDADVIPWTIAIVAFAAGVLIARVLRRIHACLDPRPNALARAWSVARVDEVLQMWGRGGRADMRRWLRLDDVFVLTYLALLTMFCFRIIRNFRPEVLPALGDARVAVGVLAWFGALCDWTENAAMKRMLDNARGFLPRLTTICTYGKWVGVLLPTGYVALYIVWKLWRFIR